MRHYWSLLMLVTVVSAGRAAEYTTIIRGARVIDGTGTPARSTDIGIKGDRITALADLRNATADSVVEARGMIATPGFIDSHSHLGDHELLRAELAGCTPMLAQGVTTVLVNADGWGVVDLATQRAMISKAKPGVNVALMIGHKAVRVAVLGLADRLPNGGDLDRMRELVRVAFQRDGAFGLSTGLIYPPASFAKTDELIALARVASEFGGFYHSHIRDESDATVGWIPAIDELVTIAREAKVTGIITHIKASGPKTWGRTAEVIQRIDAARASGVSVWADQYPYEAGTTYLSAMILPSWAQAGGLEQARVRLADPTIRAKIRADMLVAIERRSGPGALMIARFPPDRSVEGRRLDEIARQRGAEPVDVAIDLLQQDDPIALAFSIRREDMVSFMKQPWTMTGSDGFGVAESNPRSYGTFARKIRVYALDEKVISLERAINSMTGQSAEVLGLRDRGVLRVGAIADVVVFDPAKFRDTATYERPHQLAEGMIHVLVNGQAAVVNGQITGTRAGQLLSRAPADVATAAPASSWERLAPLPVGNGGFVSAAIEGEIVVAGGTTWKDDIKYWLDQIWVYDPRRNAWREAGRLPAASGYGVSGHDDSSNTVWIAGGSTGTETNRALWKIEPGLRPARVASLDRAVVNATGAKIGSALYVVGGTDDQANLERLTNHVFSIDLTTGATSQLADYPEDTLTTATAAAVGNRLFVFGGGRWDSATKTVVNHSTAFAYSVATRRWEKLPPLPYPIRGMTAAALDDRHIFLAGGYRNDEIEFVTDAFVFDVQTKTYVPTKPLPYAAMVSLVKSGDWLYCLGGEDRKKHRTDAAYRIRWRDLLPTSRAGRPQN